MSMRRALADLFVAVRADPAQPQEISRRFGLDKTLTWRLSRVVCEDDAWAAAPFIPRKPSLEILANTMTGHGAPTTIVDAMRRAAEEYEQFVEEHAGDRETLEIMVSSGGADGAAKRMEQFRKDGFQANTAIWGVRARLHLALKIMTPSETPGFVDMLTICGFVGFRRLRQSVRWSVAALAQWDVNDNQGMNSLQAFEALEPMGDSVTVPILKQFCSQPLPKMFSATSPDGVTRFMLDEGPVGNKAAADVLVGWLSRRSAPIQASYPGECGEHGAFLTTPAEMFIHDLVIHRSLEFAMRPSAHVYGHMPGGPQYPNQSASASELPVGPSLRDLGASPPDFTTPEMTNYRDIVDFGMARLGFDPEDFQGYRMRLKYPPIPAISIIRHELVPAPGESATK